MEESSQWIINTSQQAKLHKTMCVQLSYGLSALLLVFPSLEALRPGCKPGMQALSALNLALERAKDLIRYCASSSKLYLALTGDTIVIKFTRVSSDLDANLMQLAEIVAESLSHKVATVRKELSHREYALDLQDKQIGASIIALLLQEKNERSGDEVVFEQIATDLGILSQKSVLEERHALKKLLEKAEGAGDKKKASILIYFLHRLKHYSKNVKSLSSNVLYGDRHEDIVDKKNVLRSHTMDRGANGKWCTNIPPERLNKNIPEQFTCPICQQLMSDPVIIASGQTYDRLCVKRWFEQGNDTCPCTNQVLKNQSVTENVCVKNLIALWCSINDTLLPEIPPSPSFSMLSWNSMSSAGLDISLGSEESYPTDSPRVLSFSADKSSPRMDVNDASASKVSRSLLNAGARLNGDWCLKDLSIFIAGLSSYNWEVRCESAKNIQILTRDSPEAFAYMGENAISLLVNFLGDAVHAGNIEVQEVGVLILLNLSIFDRGNEEKVVNAGVIPYLLELLKGSGEPTLKEVTLSLLMILSCSEANKKHIGMLGVIPILLDLLDPGSCLNMPDILITICNLSTYSENQRQIIEHTNAIPRLVRLMKVGDEVLSSKCLLIIYHITSLKDGRQVLMEVDGCLTTIIGFLKAGTREEQEHASAILLVLCDHNLIISNLIK